MKTLLQIQSEFENGYKYLRYESPFSGFVFLTYLEKNHLDFTRSFRKLSQVLFGKSEESFVDDSQFGDFQKKITLKAGQRYIF